VIGVRIIAKVDQLMARIPIVQTIYGSTKKLIDSFRTPPVGLQRVVLIDFPHSQMKTVGLVTRTLEDEHTGAKLAVVYVPTAPNPTSGYLEIVPIDKLISTDWTMDDAMTFVVSGGAVAPNEVNFTVSKDPPEITIPPANKKAAAE